MARPLPPLDRSPAFHYREGALHCEQVPLARLARRFLTPLYIYSATAIRDRFHAFDRAFRHLPHTVCYSVKANSNLALLRLLNKLGAGFDVVSGGELARVLAVDRAAASKTVFSGVGKTEEEMELALESGLMLFNVESAGELESLARSAARARKKAPLAVRINPDIDPQTHPYVSTGLAEHKFGVTLSQARDLYRDAARSKHLEVAGISVHIGSQINRMEPFAEAMVQVAELARELGSAGHSLRFLDAGGGLGIDYEQRTAPDYAARFAQYAHAIMQPLKGLPIHALLEPGRVIVGPAGALLTEVLYVKRNGNKRFLVVDAGMNDLLRPSLYGAFHHVVPVVLPEEEAGEIFDVVGPLCETGDFLARDRELHGPQPGDLLAVLDVGAYGMSLASNYNTRARPAEAMVQGKSAKLIRRRETLLDLLGQEM